MNLKTPALLLAMAAGFFLPFPCSATPSFDCTKALRPIDRLICRSAKLSDLDSRMADEYSGLKVKLSLKQQANVLQSQRQWVKARAVCHDEACLEAAYDDRLRYFAGLAQGSVVSDAPPQNEVLPAETVAGQGKIAYASRAGMTVTITTKSGIDTANAEISYVHTPQDAKAECVEYDLDQSDACVSRVMHDVGTLNGTIYGNCRTGIFTTVAGGMYAFLREHPGDRDPLAIAPAFEINDLAANQIMSGSSASGYPVAMDNLGALCPSFGAREEWIEKAASHNGSPTQYSDPGPSPTGPISPGAGPTRPEDFEVDRAGTLGQILAVAGPIWCLSAEECEITSRENAMIGVPFSTAALPRAMRLRLVKCGPGGAFCSGIVVGRSVDEMMVHLAAKAVTLRQSGHD